MTTKQKLMARLREIAAPVVEHYKTDLGHDDRALQHGAPGDLWLWQPRPCGTHLVAIKLKRDDGSPRELAEQARSRLEFFDAVNNPAYGPARQWYLLTADSHYGDGYVARISQPKAREMLRQAEARRTMILAETAA